MLEKGTRIGIIADLHNNFSRTKQALKFMGNLDILLCAGDFLNGFRQIENFKETYSQFAKIFSTYQNFFLVPGNHEIKDEKGGLGELEKCSIHKKVVDINGLTILGYGGGIKFPATGPSKEFYSTEKIYRTNVDELDFLLEKHYNETNERLDILLMHDITGLKGIINKHEPKIVITGHDHEQGREKISGTNTEWIKCGPVVPFDEKNIPLIGKSCYSFIEYDAESIRIGLSYFEKNKNLK